MPRRAGESSSPSTGPLAEIRAGLGLDEKKTGLNGYEVESVCLPCLSMLQGKLCRKERGKIDGEVVTAAPVSILRSLPLKRLKDYLAAYGIPCVGPSEKEDFVQAVIKARNPATGSLTPEAEVGGVLPFPPDRSSGEVAGLTEIHRATTEDDPSRSKANCPVVMLHFQLGPNLFLVPKLVPLPLPTSDPHHIHSRHHHPLFALFHPQLDNHRLRLKLHHQHHHNAVPRRLRKLLNPDNPSHRSQRYCLLSVCRNRISRR